jgi:hypothetical protein
MVMVMVMLVPLLLAGWLSYILQTTDYRLFFFWLFFFFLLAG